MSKEKKLLAMPEAYRTPAGRVVSANPNLHRLVTDQKGKYGSYVPCDEEGNAVGPQESAMTFTAEDMVAEKQRGIDQGWEEARAELGAAIETAKTESFEAGKQAGLAEAKDKTAKPSGKKQSK